MQRMHRSWSTIQSTLDDPLGLLAFRKPYPARYAHEKMMVQNRSLDYRIALIRGRLTLLLQIEVMRSDESQVKCSLIKG